MGPPLSLSLPTAPELFAATPNKTDTAPHMGEEERGERRRGEENVIISSWNLVFVGMHLSWTGREEEERVYTNIIRETSGGGAADAGFNSLVKWRRRRH